MCYGGGDKMKAYEVIKLACELCEDDFADKLEDIENISFSEDEQKKIKKLLSLLDLVTSEAATERPLTCEETLKSENGKLMLKNLGEKLLSVVSIKNENGRRLNYKIFSSYISVEAESVKIRYTYLPKKATIDSEVETHLPLRILAFALAREICLSEGLNEDADIFEERYKAALSLLPSLKRRASVSGRRWL